MYSAQVAFRLFIRFSLVNFAVSKFVTFIFLIGDYFFIYVGGTHCSFWDKIISTDDLFLVKLALKQAVMLAWFLGILAQVFCFFFFGGGGRIICVVIVCAQNPNK